MAISRLLATLLIIWVCFAVAVIVVMFDKDVGANYNITVSSSMVEKFKSVNSAIIGGCAIALVNLLASVGTKDSLFFEKQLILGSVAAPSIVWISLGSIHFSDALVAITCCQVDFVLAVLLVIVKIDSLSPMIITFCYILFSLALFLVSVASYLSSSAGNICFVVGLVLGGLFLLVFGYFTLSMHARHIDSFKALLHLNCHSIFYEMLIIFYSLTALLIHALVDQGEYKTGLMLLHVIFSAVLGLLFVSISSGVLSGKTDLHRGYIRYIGHEIRTPLNIAVLGCELLSKDTAHYKSGSPSYNSTATASATASAIASAESSAYEIRAFQRISSGDSVLEPEVPKRELIHSVSVSDNNVLMQVRDSLTVATITLNNVVDHQNLVSGHISLDKSFTNVELFCNECLSSLQPRASNKANSFKISNYIDPLATMFVDKTMFGRALSNLGVSALDLSPPNSLIELLIDKDDSDQVMIILTNAVDCVWLETPQKFSCSDTFQFDARELMASTSSDHRRLDMDLGFFVSTGIVKLHGGEVDMDWCPNGSKYCQFCITVLLPHDNRHKFKPTMMSSFLSAVMSVVDSVHDQFQRMRTCFASLLPNSSNTKAVSPEDDDMSPEVSMSVVGNLPPKPNYDKKSPYNNAFSHDLSGIEGGLSKTPSFNDNMSSKSSKSSKSSVFSRNVSNSSQAFSRNTSIESRISRNMSNDSRISRNTSVESRYSRASSASRSISRNNSGTGDFSPLSSKAMVRHALLMRDNTKDDDLTANQLSNSTISRDFHLDLSKAIMNTEELSRSPHGLPTAGNRQPIQVSARSTSSLLSREESSARVGQFLLGQTVLIVDDSDVSRKMTAMYLRKVGAKIHEASDGDEAVEIIRLSLISYHSNVLMDMHTHISPVQTDRKSDGIASESFEDHRHGVLPKLPLIGDHKSSVTVYDFILMDYLMPNMNGDLACKHIRELGYTGVIVGLTGHALKEDTSTYLEHGANTVMTKPLDILKLHSFLDEIGHLKAHFSVDT